MNNKKSFSELGLPQPLVEAVSELGFEEPSAIQIATIPVALSGRDLVGLSETGSGKTAAFALPSLSKLNLESPDPQLLVICPTRELAIQVCDEVNRLGAKLPRLKTIAIYGGAPMDRQFRALHQGVQVIVGTPGRLCDHIKRGSFDPATVHTVVLDEADRMLDMGFLDEMEGLLRALPEDRQTLFFSATMNRQVQALIQRFGRQPEMIQIERPTLTVESVNQVSYQVHQQSKMEVLCRIIDLDQPRLAIVFCNTKKAVDECTEALLSRGYSADRLHGDITQILRERVIRMFRDGIVEILVATDVAARGIDIDNVDIVFNYDLPQDPEDYVHRIGRTGRAGRSGKAVSFLHGRDVYRLHTIERYIRQQISREKVPSREMVEDQLETQLMVKIEENLANQGVEDCSAQIQALVAKGFQPAEIASVLLAMLREETGRESEAIREDQATFRPAAAASEPREKPGRKEKERKREPRERDRDGETEEGMTRLFLNLGKSQHLRPGDIAGMMHNELGLPSGALGRINITPRFTLIEIASEFVEPVIAEARNTKLRGKKFILDVDRASGGRGEGAESRPPGPKAESRRPEKTESRRPEKKFPPREKSGPKPTARKGKRW